MYLLYMFCVRPPQTGCGCKTKADYSRTRERDTDLITESNKRRRLSLQMFCLDMMAPSITTPHVRGGGMSMTQLKSHCRSGICRTVSQFHSVSRAPLLPSFQPSPLPLLVHAALLSFAFTFKFLLCVDNRNVQSFSSGARN